MTSILVIGDPHAHPDYSNRRATWIGNLIADTKPTEVICIGDLADMVSLCTYDKGSRASFGRSYSRDIAAACEFNDRLWQPVRARKRRLPKRIILEGNHEHRIERALDTHPELEGTVSFNDLQYDRYYDTVIRYNGGTPGVYTSNDIVFAHYLVSGSMGRPIGGEHIAYSLLTKKFVSCVVGHDHRLDYCQRTRADGVRINGLCVGHSADYEADWAGHGGDQWWSGVCLLDNVDKGNYDLRCIGMHQLRKEYS